MRTLVAGLIYGILILTLIFGYPLLGCPFVILYHKVIS